LYLFIFYIIYKCSIWYIELLGNCRSSLSIQSCLFGICFIYVNSLYQCILSLWHCLILLTCSGSAWWVITVTKMRKIMTEDHFAGMYLPNLSHFDIESTSQQSHAFCDMLTLPTCLRMTGNVFTKWSAWYIHKFCLHFFCMSRAKLLQKVMITPKADLISIKSTITFSPLLHLAWNLVDIVLVHYLILWIVIL